MRPTLYLISFKTNTSTIRTQNVPSEVDVSYASDRPSVVIWKRVCLQPHERTD